MDQGYVFGRDLDHILDTLNLSVGRKFRTIATAGLRVEQGHCTVHVCGCTGTTVSINPRHLRERICCSPVTALCRFQCGVVEVYVLYRVPFNLALGLLYRN